MENDVGGLRDSFYQNLRREYRMEGADSFLYRYFWTEAVTELLEEYRLSVDCPIAPENSGTIRAGLETAVRERRDLLLRPVPEKRRRKSEGEKGRDKGQKERRGFWEELWLNDAGYQAGLISDTDYYLWLVEYLAAHDLYYKDDGICLWLDRLLREGWLGAGEARVPGLWRQKSGKSVFSVTRFGADLQELAERLRTNREEIASRLHGLEEEGEDYLPLLTGRLEQTALHIKIRDWLQNSGYPLVKEEDMSARFSAKRSRKQDFSMRLLEAYCASGRGDGFFRRDQDTGTSISGWRLTDDGFCLPDEEEVAALQKALEESGETCFYIPLAVDLRSGCVLFLAGKDIYEQVYQEQDKKWAAYTARVEKEFLYAQDVYRKAQTSFFNDIEKLKKSRDEKKADLEAARKGHKRAQEIQRMYESSPSRLCFDYLRLDKAQLVRVKENPAGAFCLWPDFHRKVKEEYQAVLKKFMAYCKGECDRTPREAIPREAVREFNWDLPADLPRAFRWTVEGRSQESEDAFLASRSRPLESPGGPPIRTRP